MSRTFHHFRTWELAAELRIEMQEAAVQMEYEKAAYLRDEISKLEQAIKRLPAEG